MLDAKNFREPVTGWFRSHPEHERAARDDFESPGWFDLLVIDVYPCPPSDRVRDVIRKVAQEALQTGGEKKDMDLEERLNKRLCTEQVTGAQFSDDRLEKDLKIVAYDPATRQGKSMAVFQSGPLTAADQNKVRKGEWFTKEDFEHDFPGAFDGAASQVREAAQQLDPVAVIGREDSESSEIADPKNAQVEFGGAWTEMDGYGVVRAQMRLDITVPLEKPALAQAEAQ
jgi:hypothetical protein